ncbi:MAG: hypothetical protein R3C99_18875 [Pirellulaceae bacterium]
MLVAVTATWAFFQTRAALEGEQRQRQKVEATARLASTHSIASSKLSGDHRYLRQRLRQLRADLNDGGDGTLQPRRMA